MSALIELKNITKIYKQGEIEIPALLDVNLNFKKGEFAAIMGASGSGKSTLMNILGCLDKPTRGEYIFEDIPVTKYSPDKLAWIRNKKIGFVFQNFNLIPRTTALENVETPLYYHNMLFSFTQARKRALEVLRTVGLEGREHHTPVKLSGGEQQRVAIARALVNNPSIILADEPTGNLDTKTSVEIMALLQKLNREQNITVILVTHEPDIATFTRRNIKFSDGRMVKDEVLSFQADAQEFLIKLRRNGEGKN